MPWWNAQHMYSVYNFPAFNGLGSLLFLPFLIPLLIWSFIWKGLALYRAARNGQKIWFIVMMIANTAGILEIIYLLFFSKPEKKMKYQSS